MSTAVRTVQYHDADVALSGVLYGGNPHRRLPGVLVVHGGAGLDEHARQQGERWAAEGYTVFVCDLYGDGVAGDRQRVMASLTALRDDPSLLARRGHAGLDALREHGNITEAVGIIGYCFGGMAALTLARSGAAVAAVVSVHGSLHTSQPARPGAVTAQVLVCHGSADPHIPLEHVAALATEMDHARADWQLIMYGSAMHGFTHRNARADTTSGVAYDEVADRRSFAAATRFLADAVRNNG